ncbi:uncharacterized protein LOC131937552 [Physella acuta]|uniref:uncharacterized protein LOC131937552 n=1 Tax=Physella acuta TaxID=109671 RepID=UPI0027DD2939|nr:uncharacterized protein LOC131937552 [Physella acuta]
MTDESRIQEEGIEAFSLSSDEESLQHDKWIIVTSIASPTEQVKYLAMLKDWRLVVVGDRKSPATWSLPSCDYLSVETQKQLGYDVIDHLPYGSYARKNIGYLYAIQHGAKVIYETDDDNRPNDDLKNFVLTPTTPGLMFVGNNVFNPYLHFGQSTLWPRGFPLSYIGKKQQRLYKVSSNWNTPTIQQGLVNGDPDMDAIFRLSRKSESTPLNVTFDPLAPPAILPEGVFSPFNSQNTLFHQAAFWALFLPTTTTFRMCDIWRGYWAQRLMWEIGGTLGFFPANAYQVRNSHSYIEDAKQEKDMYFQTEELIEFLRNWKCEENIRFFQCVIKLTSDMADEKYWQHEDVKLVRLWLNDLNKLGYQEPQRVQFREITLKTEYNDLHGNILVDNFATGLVYENRSSLNNVWYSSVEQEEPSLSQVPRNKESAHTHVEKMVSMCDNLKYFSFYKMYESQRKNTSVFSETLLIVVFNFPFYKNIRYLDAIHNQVFKYIVYCGENINLFLQETGDLGKTLTFIEVFVDKGIYGYMCAVKAMEMGYRVSGFLVAGDDVLFKPWVLMNMNQSQAGITHRNILYMNTSEITNVWQWWGRNEGRQAYLQTIQDLHSTKDVPLGVKNISDFLDTLYTQTRSKELVPKGYSDFYYIPKTLQRSAIWYLTKFYSNKLFLEIAVPVMFCGLEHRERLQWFRGASGNHVKEDLKQFYLTSYSFTHPAKLTYPETVAVYCNHYFPDLLRNYFKLIETH